MKQVEFCKYHGFWNDYLVIEPKVTDIELVVEVGNKSLQQRDALNFLK